MNILIELIIAFFATLGSAILFSSTKETIVHTGIAGSLGWVCASLSGNLFDSTITGTFFGALTVGLLAEFFARAYKKPATVYITPGIIPLVPGAGMYYTMLYIIENNFSMAVHKGVETFFVACAIAIGIIISSGFSKSIKRVRQTD